MFGRATYSDLVSRSRRDELYEFSIFQIPEKPGTRVTRTSEHMVWRQFRLERGGGWLAGNGAHGMARPTFRIRALPRIASLMTILHPLRVQR